ncbi:hypothetical protein [Rhizobium oryzicola]|uniref:Uncharacterized protein n=1 Tax=Rhizobium oryzicola TaxID=1232668 RepID=A0ABT8T3V3_9HYPH|nr:hypothetical protein [Rhizobium oryzicola]MDO1585327.1 hypothetical protein [Rhizobium oryzicola]
MPAFYADLIAELRDILTELDRQPERFQTFDVHLELAASGGMVVYEMKRAKGVTDSLFWGRAPSATENRQITQAAAFAAIDRFFGLGEFLALSDDLPAGTVLDETYPCCAVRFAYRKKGAPRARSLSMIFIGFNDRADAAAYAEHVSDTIPLAQTRPLMGAELHEWR